MTSDAITLAREVPEALKPHRIDIQAIQDGHKVERLGARSEERHAA